MPCVPISKNDQKTSLFIKFFLFLQVHHAILSSNLNKTQWQHKY